MNYEQRRTIVYKAPKSGDTIKLQVGEFGRVWYKKRFLKQVLINPVQGYLYCLAPKEANFRGLLPVHRLVAMAWVPGRSRIRNVVNHIDSNKQNNFACNLEWVTKRANNKTEHARLMKSKNASNRSHANECIKATKGDVVHYYKNGRIAARAIGCSYPLVYLVLNPDHFAKTAKGWHLEWVPLESVNTEIIHGAKKEQK